MRRRWPRTRPNGSRRAKASSPTIARPAISRPAQGVPDAFPPLAKSDYLNGGKTRAIKTVTGGLNGKVEVNGKTYDGVMPAWDLPDEDIANVLTYAYNSWGNSGEDVTPAEVKASRMKAN